MIIKSADVDAPEKLLYTLQQMERRLGQVEQKKPFGTADRITDAVRDQLLLMASRALAATGPFPLNVQNLLGVLSMAQLAKAVYSNTLPTTPSAEQYDEGTIGINASTSPVGFYYVKAGVPKSWQSLPSSPSNFWTTDSPQTIAAGAAKTLSDLLTLLAGLTVTAGTSTFASNVDRTGANGSYFRFASATEQLTLTGLTTDTSASLLSGNALILAVLTRITTTISGGGVTTWSVGDPTTATRFSSANANLTAGNGGVGINQWKGGVATDAAGPTQASPAKVRITCDAAPSAGVVRIQVFSIELVAPTS